jgi:hypothetical protein
MSIENHILEALEIVSTWDVEDIAQALNDQARLMAGIDPEESWEDLQDFH